MKIIALRDARASLSSYVDQAQGDQLLITKHGRPAALLVGVEGEAMEDLLTRADPEFWKMIEERRKPGRKTYSADEARKKLGLSPSAAPAAATPKKPARHRAR